jgi:adenylate kinase family enzyme
MNNIKKIAVIGNAGGGKTTLSRKLSQVHKLPLHHVDTHQFVAGMQRRENFQTVQILNQIQEQDSWIIDGFGPLDIIEKRFMIADRIIMVDFPLWHHFYWSTKRQIKSLWAPRTELPAGCNEFTIEHTVKLYKTIWKVHTQMRPELLRILARENNRDKVVHVKNKRDWRNIFDNGLKI